MSWFTIMNMDPKELIRSLKHFKKQEEKKNENERRYRKQPSILHG